MTVAGIFGGVVAFIQAIPIVNSWFQQLVFFWIQSQKDGVRTDLNDVLALAARTETKEERFALSGKWQDIFKKPRVSA